MSPPANRLMLDIAIVGAGAMGCLFGARLALAGHHVMLIDVDPRQIDAIRRDGLHLEADDGDHRIPLPIGPAGTFSKPVDLVLLFTKAQHSTAALAAARHLVTPESWVLTLQNGLGGGDRAAAALEHGHVAIGTTNWPADLVAPGHVSTHGAGTVKLWSHDGGAHPMLEVISDALTAAGFASGAVPDVKVAIWEKVIFNAALNPVAALARATVGGIAKSADGLALVDAVLAEAFEIAAAAGVAVDPLGVRASVVDALASHGAHQPSMLKDVLAGRATEVDLINGALVDHAGTLGVRAEVNKTLLRLVRLAQEQAKTIADRSPPARPDGLTVTLLEDQTVGVVGPNPSGAGQEARRR